MSEVWKSGSSYRWRKVRLYVFARDGNICKLQIKGVCTNKATEVHHLVGREVSGDDPHYLTVACRPCNLKAGKPAFSQPKRISNW